MRRFYGLLLLLASCTNDWGSSSSIQSHGDNLEPRSAWLRWREKPLEVDQPARFGAGSPFLKTKKSRAQLEAVPTFESVGLYWSPELGAGAGYCQVRYRRIGAHEWRQGLPLWFDAKGNQCRGSLVHLRSGTRYEVEVQTVDHGEFASVAVETWSERYPIAETITLPETSNEPLRINRSGRPDGYLLFAAAPGKSATIDLNGSADRAIEVKGSYVIIRGLTVKGARRHLIVLENGVHDVVIEDNDLSGWGDVHIDGWGVNHDSAIYSKGKARSVKRIVIQRNRIHHPRSNSNAWDEYREAFRTRHPLGPQAITLWNSGGNHVIRYNDIYSDENHQFNDCIGAGTNFSEIGFPHKDSDIYGNRISHCRDDAIEAEGGNINVRIWANYLDLSYVMIAMAATEVGPIYVWRNVGYRSRRSATREFERSDRGYFLKIQNKYIKRKKRTFGGGKMYAFNNTLLQCGPRKWGVKAGPSDLRGGRITNLVTRNNIFMVSGEKRPSIADNKRDKSNDFDFDLYNGRIIAAPGQQQNGIRGVPTFLDEDGCGEFGLSPGSEGQDAGVVIPNFADEYYGRAPDMGAQEIGAPRLEFGVDAPSRIGALGTS